MIRYTFTEDAFVTLCGLKKVVHHLETLKTLTKSTPSTLGDDITELNSQIHALIANAEETVEEVED